MAYVALYRKFRPLKFADVIGQEHITKTIKNQVINNRVAHAYLFSGGRGSGKTSTAKILARAVNCMSPIDGEPCNECEMCKAAIAGNLVDITEMDAASNNGVDNIREIREEVEFIPTAAKYRVYIIDEVHMLSTGAFNALLKTLEEPPAHVIFILATTEPQKLPNTILSRCQRYDFKHISINDIVTRLKYICSQSDVQIEDEAAKIIADLADGAMRDAISILDRCVSDGDKVVTAQKIREISGVPEFELLYEMTKAILSHDSESIINLCEQISNSGKNLNVFLSSLIKFQRDAAMIEVDKDLVMYSNDEKDKLISFAKQYDKSCFLDLIIKISNIQNSIKWSMEQNIIFETGLLRIALEDNSAREGVSSSNIKASSTTSNTSKSNVSNQMIASTSSNIVQNSEQSEKFFSNNSKVEVVSSGDLYAKVLTNLAENGKIRIHTDLKNANIELMQDGIVHIIFNEAVNAFSKANLLKDETKQAIKQAVISALGREVSVKYDNLK